jgi:hypothetical protein
MRKAQKCSGGCPDSLPGQRVGRLHDRFLVVLITLVFCHAACLAATCQQQPTAATQVESARKYNPVASSELKPLSSRAIDNIRKLCLGVLPEQIEETDDWGGETRIQSGLKVRMDGLQVRTNRRWKSVNHGMWKRVVVKLVDPDTTFRLSVFQVDEEPDQPPRRLITAAARVRVTGQVQQWNYGVMLWSVTAEALADVSFQTEFVVDQTVQQTDKGISLRLVPEVRNSKVQLDGFSLRRVSHLKGSAIRGVGDMFEPLLVRRLRRENKSLDQTINDQLKKEADRLEMSLNPFSGLFGSE